MILLMDICLIMCNFALVFMYVNFMNFYCVKMDKKGVLWCFCEVIIVNEFCISLGILGLYFI